MVKIFSWILFLPTLMFFLQFFMRILTSFQHFLLSYCWLSWFILIYLQIVLNSEDHLLCAKLCLCQYYFRTNSILKEMQVCLSVAFNPHEPAIHSTIKMDDWKKKVQWWCCILHLPFRTGLRGCGAQCKTFLHTPYSTSWPAVVTLPAVGSLSTASGGCPISS